MTSPVDICNAALSLMGSRSTITNLNEGSAEAINCSIWYDRLRKQLLRSAPWGFARTQVLLTQLGSLAASTAPYPWAYKYSYPNDCLKLRYILPQPSDPTQVTCWSPSRAYRFLVANDPSGRVLLSNVFSAIGVYTKDEGNPAMFDPLFEGALIALLAAHLVIPLSGNANMRAQFIQLARDTITEAKVADGNEAIPTSDFTPDWIAARGASSFAPAIFDLGQWYSGYDNMSWGE